jgi:3-oxoadipate enol-lactonase
VTRSIAVSDGTQIAFDTLGEEDAPPIVLLHSLGCTHHMWDHQLGQLARARRVVAIDLRGHGDSDAPDEDYTLERLGTDVIDVVDGLGIDGFDYCGLSIGGLIGLWLGLNAAGRLRSLTICNSGAKISEIERWNERIEIARSQGMEPLVDAVIDRWFTTEYLDAKPQEVEQLRFGLLETDPRGYAGCCAAIRGADLREDVHTITTRTLMIAGTGDIATPPDLSAFLHEQIKGSAITLLEAGHLSNVEQPQAFTDALLQFLG